MLQNLPELTNYFKTSDLFIIGSSGKIEVISLIIRKGRGIASPGDLQGKIIAVPKGTQAEFFLGRYLTLHGMTLSNISIHYLSPGNLYESMIVGACDGAIIWEPYCYNLQQNLPGQVEIWPAQSGQMYFITTYTRSEILDHKYPILIRYFEALYEAEKFVNAHTSEVKSTIKKSLNVL